MFSSRNREIEPVVSQTDDLSIPTILTRGILGVQFGEAKRVDTRGQRQRVLRRLHIGEIHGLGISMDWVDGAFGRT